MMNDDGDRVETGNPDAAVSRVVQLGGEVADALEPDFWSWGKPLMAVVPPVEVAVHTATRDQLRLCAPLRQDGEHFVMVVEDPRNDVLVQLVFERGRLREWLRVVGVTP